MQTDVLIIGCGIAGATAALRLAADRQRQVTVITRAADPRESNSRHAQGGIATVGRDDSPDRFAQDILKAGAGLSFKPAVDLLVEEGPLLLDEILEQSAGLAFDRDELGQRAFGLEGAHSRRRVLHVGDETGDAIMQSLQSRMADQPNVRLLTSHTAVDLLTFPHHSLDPMAIYDTPRCHGAYVLDQVGGNVIPILASRTILASGGLGQIFLNTSNPAGARGDGLAMAYRAGARIANAEYIQFHPTTLHMPGSTKFLISEAVRGEGAVLLTPRGERFMERYSPEWKELAPRDLVSRAIYWEMLSHDYSFVLLDIASRNDAGYIRNRFPGIYRRCKELNLDITQQPIPVVPAAHYSCGGITVDLWGRSSIDGLYAIGEASCTGVHGANRLASTSLLEGLVWGDRSARDIVKRSSETPLSEDRVPAWDTSKLSRDADPALILGDIQNVRNVMWHYVGLVRSQYHLNRAIRELRHLWFEIEEFYRTSKLTDSLIGLRNAILVALIVGRAAHSNPTSRGCHYRDDSRPPQLPSPGS